MLGLRRSRSYRSLDEIELKSICYEEDQMETVCKHAIFSLTSENSCNPVILSTIGKAIFFKKYGDQFITSIISRNTLGPLKPKPFTAKNLSFSHKYYLRLACLIEYFKSECSNSSALLFLAQIERIVDEIRPALFMRLINPSLDRLVTGLSAFLNSKSCVDYIKSSIIQFKQFIRYSSKTRAKANKIRLFIIPLYGLITITSAYNKRIANKFKRLLNNREILRALIEYPCESDDISLGCNRNQIPPIVSYSEDCQFFRNLPHSRDKDLYKLNFIGKSDRNSVGRELILRRCASFTTEHLPERVTDEEREFIMHKITEWESAMTCSKLIRSINDYIVDCKYECVEDSFISEGIELEGRNNLRQFQSFPTI